jgi:hypothetical protein
VYSITLGMDELAKLDAVGKALRALRGGADIPGSLDTAVRPFSSSVAPEPDERLQAPSTEENVPEPER